MRHHSGDPWKLRDCTKSSGPCARVTALNLPCGFLKSESILQTLVVCVGGRGVSCKLHLPFERVLWISDLVELTAWTGRRDVNLILYTCSSCLGFLAMTWEDHQPSRS